MTAATKITLILMASATAFCLWSVAWMALAAYRTLRDTMKETTHEISHHH